MNLRLVSCVVAAMGLLDACSAGSSSETVGSSQHAITGGSNDSNDVNANVVVEIRDAFIKNMWASGVLIAPLVVLTANHVIWGSTSSPAHTGNTPYIQLQVVGTSQIVQLPVSA